MFETLKKVEKQMKLNVSDFFRFKVFWFAETKNHRLEMHEEITGTRIFSRTTNVFLTK